MSYSLSMRLAALPEWIPEAIITEIRKSNTQMFLQNLNLKGSERYDCSQPHRPSTFVHFRRIQYRIEAIRVKDGSSVIATFSTFAL